MNRVSAQRDGVYATPPTPVALRLVDELLRVVGGNDVTLEEVRPCKRAAFCRDERFGVYKRSAHAYGYAVAGLMRQHYTATLDKLEHEPDVKPPKPGSLQDQLPKSYRPRERGAGFKKVCANCRWFEANPKGGMGKCHNEKKAAQLGAEPPLLTSAGATNCSLHRPPKD